MPSVIFYGAGDTARRMIDRFIEKAGKPVCFADASPDKHYTRFDFAGGAEILPLDAAVAKYPDYELWLTIDRGNLFEVTKYLIKQGIGRERIHYFEDVEFRLGCRNFGRLITANPEAIKTCCYPKGKLLMCADGKMLTTQELPRLVDEYRAWVSDTLYRFRTGQPTSCDGCGELKMGLWEKSPVVDRIAVGGGFLGVKCNCRCIYCSNADVSISGNAMRSRHTAEAYDFYFALSEIFGDSIKRVDVAEGEITVLPYRDKLLDLIIEKGWTAQIHTSGMLYNEKVAEILRRHTSMLNVSLDSGTPETYMRVKGVDAFNRVVSNLERYALDSAWIVLKYFVLKDINCNHKDIDGFVDIAKRLRVFKVVFSYDMKNIRSLSNAEFELVEYLIARANQYGVKIEYAAPYFIKPDRDRFDALIKQ